MKRLQISLFKIRSFWREPFCLFQPVARYTFGIWKPKTVCRDLWTTVRYEGRRSRCPKTIVTWLPDQTRVLSTFTTGMPLPRPHRPIQNQKRSVKHFNYVFRQTAAYSKSMLCSVQGFHGINSDCKQICTDLGIRGTKQLWNQRLKIEVFDKFPMF